MEGIPISVDPEAINKYIADQILASTLGERLTSVVDSALRTQFGHDPLKNAVAAEVQRQIMELVKDEYADRIRTAIINRLTDSVLDQLIDQFMNSLTARLDR